ncbi:uncharacterized protein LOC118781699, partial [Megalops cyprinoides]|uniref:uncharacterized protein LOC118781699 n=1 Tax=Megalops cyprinoides TaxID=118141 RepID=UPI0018656BAE
MAAEPGKKQPRRDWDGGRNNHNRDFKKALITPLLKKPSTDPSDVTNYRPSAAFDTVNHQTLLSKLSEMGISGTALSWFTSYLTGRSSQVNERISACLADISKWMTSHHLKLNLSKTELLFIPAGPSPLHDLSITVDGTTIPSSQSAKSLGVTLDSNLDFKEYIAHTSRACRFLLHNIRRIRPFLTTYATQLLIQATVLPRLDYCNALLAGLPACTTQPLQLIQNAAARLIFNLPKFSHVTPLLKSLHWLPVAARIRFKTLTLAFSAVNRTAPAYLHELIQPYTPARPLRSAATGRLAPCMVKAGGARSARHRRFTYITPQWWNELPVSLRTASSPQSFRWGLKTHLFRL